MSAVDKSNNQWPHGATTATGIANLDSYSPDTLATVYYRDRLKDTGAQQSLIDGGKEFQKKGFVKSANLFLNGWRILQTEYEEALHTYTRPRGTGPKSFDTSHETQYLICQHRWFLGLVALLDLSLACFESSDEEYQDQDGKYKLQLNALSSLDDIIAEDFSIMDDTKPISDNIGIPLTDPIGRLLKGAKSFRDAAIKVAYLALLSLDHVRQKSYLNDKLTSLGSLIPKNIALINKSDSKRPQNSTSDLSPAYQSLATPNYRDELNGTNAEQSLLDGVEAFQNKEYIESANLFLTAWRIIQNEYEVALYTYTDILHLGWVHERFYDEHIVQYSKCQHLWFLGLVALLDFSLACMHSKDKFYRGHDGTCKLRLNSQLSSRYTIAEEFDIIRNRDMKSKVISEGTPVSKLGIPLRDPIGLDPRGLDGTESFPEAAARAAYLCLLSFDCVSRKPHMYDDLRTLRSLIHGTLKDQHASYWVNARETYIKLKQRRYYDMAEHADLMKGVPRPTIGPVSKEEEEEWALKFCNLVIPLPWVNQDRLQEDLRQQ